MVGARKDVPERGRGGLALWAERRERATKGLGTDLDQQGFAGADEALASGERGERMGALVRVCSSRRAHFLDEIIMCAERGEEAFKGERRLKERREIDAARGELVVIGNGDDEFDGHFRGRFERRLIARLVWSIVVMGVDGVGVGGVAARGVGVGGRVLGRVGRINVDAGRITGCVRDAVLFGGAARIGNGG